MIVISDTSCIGYLIIIDKLSLLRQNFTNIIIPLSVHKEVLPLSAKYDLTKYLNANWISIKEITNYELYKNLLKEVDEGESEAMVLSKELSADLLLIDERKGTLIARSMGINTIGLIGVLLLSKKKKLIKNIKSLLDELIANTTFRIDKNIYNNVLKAANEQ